MSEQQMQYGIQFDGKPNDFVWKDNKIVGGSGIGILFSCEHHSVIHGNYVGPQPFWFNVKRRWQRMVYRFASLFRKQPDAISIPGGPHEFTKIVPR